MSPSTRFASTEAEARLAEHRPRRLLAPHRAETHPAVGQRDGHAVHARDGVQKGGERVVQVLRQLARGRGVDAEVDAAGPQGGGDPGEHEVRPRLVMHRVEGGDEVEPGVLV
jgi:hypothetical protein